MAQQIDFAHSVLQICRQAGAEILKHYKAGQRFEQASRKLDHSYVTVADELSNEILQHGLHTLKAIPVVSEEGSFYPKTKETRVEYWLIDPLDGTREFVHGRDEFCITIALMKDSQPEFGAIYQPVKDHFTCAFRNNGAFLSQANGWRPLQVKQTLDPYLSAVISRGSDPTRLSELFRPLQFKNIDQCGSAIKFVKMAQGFYDLYPRQRPSYEWDTAAGELLVREAGGLLFPIDQRGSLLLHSPGLTYEKDDPLNPGFVVCTQAAYSALL